MRRRLSSREDRPQPLLIDHARMPDERDCGCTAKGTGTGTCSQIPASSWLRSIKAANETANRTAARVMWPIPAPMSVTGGPHCRPDASEPPARRKQHCRGGGMVYIQDVRHFDGTPAPRLRFQTAPRLGRCGLSHTLRGSVAGVGRHRWMAKPGTQLLQRREAGLDVLER